MTNTAEVAKRAELTGCDVCILEVAAVIILIVVIVLGIRKFKKSKKEKRNRALMDAGRYTEVEVD